MKEEELAEQHAEWYACLCKRVDKGIDDMEKTKEFKDKDCPNCGHKLRGLQTDHRTHWEQGYWACHGDKIAMRVPCRCIIYFNSKLEKELGLDLLRKSLRGRD